MHSATSTSRPRPILIKLCTAWDRKLLLLHRTFLRDFRIKRLFLHEDVSPDHRLRKGKSNASAEISPPDDLPVGSLVNSTASDYSTNDAFSTALPPTHPSIHHSGGPSSPAESEASLLSVCPMPVRAASPPPSHSSSSSSSSTVVQNSLDVGHDSA